MDRIFIRNIKVPCVIGVNPEERKIRREVVINIQLNTDLTTVGKTDQLDDTIDYAFIRDKIESEIQQSRFHLLEALASCVADICMENNKVVSAVVGVVKTGAIPGADIEIEIYRDRSKTGSRLKILSKNSKQP